MSSCGQEIGDAELCNRPANHPGPCSAVSTAARRWRRPESARARELRASLEDAGDRYSGDHGHESALIADVLELLAAAHQRDPQIVGELLTAGAWRE